MSAAVTRRGAGQRRGDRDEAGAGADIEHASGPRTSVGMIEHVARQRLAAGPGEGPIRRRQPGLRQRRLGRLPQPAGHLASRDGTRISGTSGARRARVGADEGGALSVVQ